MSTPALKETLKTRIDALPREVLEALSTLLDARPPADDSAPAQDLPADWLDHPWVIPGITPMTREEIYGGR
jgi:hypothetical protein